MRTVGMIYEHGHRSSYVDRAPSTGGLGADVSGAHRIVVDRYNNRGTGAM